MANFTLKDCLFGAVKLTQNADQHKYFYSKCSLEFNSCSRVLYPGFDFGESVIWSRR